MDMFSLSSSSSSSSKSNYPHTLISLHYCKFIYIKYLPYFPGMQSLLEALFWSENGSTFSESVISVSDFVCSVPLLSLKLISCSVLYLLNWT